MEDLSRIVIGEKSYPIKIDLNVLEHIQNVYGTIYEFERELMGLRYKRDAEGNQVYDADNKPVTEMTEPSIKAIRTVFPAAVNEGLAIEADAENRPFERLSESFIIRNCAIPYDILGVMLHEEFKRCFVTKKS